MAIIRAMISDNSVYYTASIIYILLSISLVTDNYNVWFYGYCVC